MKVRVALVVLVAVTAMFALLQEAGAKTSAPSSCTSALDAADSITDLDVEYIGAVGTYFDRVLPRLNNFNRYGTPALFDLVNTLNIEQQRLEGRTLDISKRMTPTVREYKRLAKQCRSGQ